MISRRMRMAFLLMGVVSVGVLVVWLPTLLNLSLQQNKATSMDAKALLPIYDAVQMYSPLDYEEVAIDNDSTMMDKDADPCEDFVRYTCGNWLRESEKYRREHPVSFSRAQRNAVGLVSGIIALEKSRSWGAASAIALFHEGCTQTRASASTWAAHSQTYQELLSAVTTSDSKWSQDVFMALLGKLARYGITLPFSVVPSPNPTDTVSGGWIMVFQQVMVIGGGPEYASNDITRVFTYYKPPKRMFQDYEDMLRLLWRGEPDMSSKTIDQKVQNVQAVQTDLARRYNDVNQRSCWAQEDSGDADSTWAAYFQNPNCFEEDFSTSENWTQEFDSIDWSSFIDTAFGTGVWAQLTGVWTPQTRRWLHYALDYNLYSEQQWRDYLEASVRFASLRHYWPAEEDARNARQRVGIFSPIISQFQTRVNPRQQQPWRYHQPQWEPSLTYNSVNVAPLSSDSVNQQRMLSEALCTDLTFVYTQPILELYYVEALGFDDVKHRTFVSSLMQDAVNELRSLVASSTSWTVSTRDFFQRKLSNLLLAIGTTPYNPLFTSESNTPPPAFNVSSRADQAALEAQTGVFADALDDGPEALVQNMFLLREQRTRHQWAIVLAQGPPRGKNSLQMPSYGINAYYDPTENSITLLAGILQPPFYSHLIETDAVLYGRLVAIVGHELGHAFDPSGRMGDWSGSVVPAGYWEDAVRALDILAFGDTEKCLVSLYNQATSRHGNHESGSQTLGENLADVIGLRVGYNTMMRALNASTMAENDLRQLQEDYFVSWGQAWCTSMSGEQERDLIHNDPHSLAEFRIALPLSNMPEFAETFQCEVGSTMNKGDTSRCVFFH